MQLNAFLVLFPVTLLAGEYPWWKILDPLPQQVKAIRAAWELGLQEKALQFCLDYGTHGGLTEKEVRAYQPSVPYNNSAKGVWLFVFQGDRQALSLPAEAKAAQKLIPAQYWPFDPAKDAQAFEFMKKDVRDPSPFAPDDFVVWSVRRYCSSPEAGSKCEVFAAESVPRKIDPERRKNWIQWLRGFSTADYWPLIQPWVTEVFKPTLERPFPFLDLEPELLARTALEWKHPEEARLIAIKYGIPILIFRAGSTISMDFTKANADNLELCPVAGKPASVSVVLQSIWEGPFAAFLGPPLLAESMCAEDPALVLRSSLWQHKDKAPAGFSFDRRRDAAVLTELLKLPKDSPAVENSGIPIALAGRGLWTSAELPLLIKLEALFSRNPQMAAAVRGVISEVRPNPLFTWFGKSALTTLGWFLLWATCLALYPRFKTVQAGVFWNPKVRWVFFMFNPLLLRVPFLRRRVMAPFREGLHAFQKRSGDAPRPKDTYYAGCKVSENGKVSPLVEALPVLNGRVVLEGESGTGKTTYLRQLLREFAEPAVYLEARECYPNVLSAISERLPGWLKDESFLSELVYLGSLAIVIDGINEVGPDVRASICSFANLMQQGTILLACQPMNLPWPASFRLLHLNNLDVNQQVEFLARHGVHADRASSFIKQCSPESISPEQQLAVKRILSNPFDLAEVASQLIAGQVPNLNDLYGQQFATVKQAFYQGSGRAFPLERFSQSVYSRLVENYDELDLQTFSTEIEALAGERMVRLLWYKSKQEAVFRHDKIRDFFLANVLRGDQAKRDRNFGDSRFRSTYIYLATIAKPNELESLQHALNAYAVRSKDTSLASEVQMLREPLPSNPGAVREASAMSLPLRVPITSD